MLDVPTARIARPRFLVFAGSSETDGGAHDFQSGFEYLDQAAREARRLGAQADAHEEATEDDEPEWQGRLAGLLTWWHVFDVELPGIVLSATRDERVEKHGERGPWIEYPTANRDDAVALATTGRASEALQAATVAHVQAILEAPISPIAQVLRSRAAQKYGEELNREVQRLASADAGERKTYGETLDLVIQDRVADILGERMPLGSSTSEANFRNAKTLGGCATCGHAAAAHHISQPGTGRNACMYRVPSGDTWGDVCACLDYATKPSPEVQSPLPAKERAYLDCEGCGEPVDCTDLERTPAWVACEDCGGMP